MYGHKKLTKADYTELKHHVAAMWQQAEGRCRRVGDKHTYGTGKTHTVKVSHLEADAKRQQWLPGLWGVSDQKLTARMLSMSLVAGDLAAKIDEKLLKRAGITKVRDEYIIGPEFVPAFEAGQVVTWMGDGAKVFSVHGPLITIHAGGRTYDVFDHELKERPGLLPRLGRAVAKFFAETEIRGPNGKEEVPGRGLWNMIQDNYCGSCHGKTIWLREPRGVSRENIECKYCGQRYDVNPALRLGRKINAGTWS